MAHLGFGLSLELTEEEFERITSQVTLFHDDLKPLKIAFNVYDGPVAQWELTREGETFGEVETDEIVSEGALKLT